MNYTYYYIEELRDRELNYDIFLSAYDGCDRTKKMYDRVNANRLKQWLIFPQYNVPIEERPTASFYCDEMDEGDYISALFTTIESSINKKSKVCIDCTGFLIPHLLLLIGRLHKAKQIKCIDVIYSEPDVYINAENTVFTNTTSPPEPIFGF